MGDSRVHIEKSPESCGESGRSVIECRGLQATPRCLLVVFVTFFVLLAVMYLPHRARYAIQFIKAQVLMGNKNSSSNASTPAPKGHKTSHSPAPCQRVNMLHHKCLNGVYPRTKDVQRVSLTEDQVPWSNPVPNYNPQSYTAPNILADPRPVWADVDIKSKNDSEDIKWNQIDGKVNRISFMGEYQISKEGVPRNPIGRTGIKGRGCLGRWGPNHAADPIVTRWKRNENGSIVSQDGKQILQFIAVQRRDNREWAIPGGMVDPGEMVSVTLKREFSEEAMNSLDATAEDRKKIEDNVNMLFNSGKEVYRGYVDDPRNTDNAWMETMAYNFHDEHGQSVGRFDLHAGDDAVGVRWTDIKKSLKLFASHANFVRKVAENHDAAW